MNLAPVQTILLFINANFLIVGICLFFTRKGNRHANRILALFLLFLSYVNTHYAFHYHKPIFLNFPNLIGTHMPFLFALPPILYVYYRRVFDSSYSIKGTNLLHFIPSLLVCLYYLPLYFSSYDYKVNFIQTGHCYINSNLFSVLFFAYFIIYLVFISVSSASKSRKLRDEKLENLIKYVRIANIISLSLIFFLLLTALFHLKFIYASLISSMFYYFILFQVFFNSEVFFSLQLLGSAFTIRKYASKSLSTSEIQDITRVLHTYMEQEKVYLNFQVSLPEIAEAVQISPHQISQAINRQTRMNFNEFVNKYRISYASTCLRSEEHKHLTIEAIGNMAGFRTRSTFINAFKKFHNCTPSQFMKDQKKVASVTFQLQRNYRTAQ